MSRTVSQFLDLASLQRFAAAIDGDGADCADPALLHWAWFNDVVPQIALGPDGHPLPGLLLPATGKPRRMFASALIEFVVPLELQTEATLTERLSDQRTKQGRSGDLRLLDVERVISQGGVDRIRESRTLVYRDAEAVTPAVAQTEAHHPGQWVPTSVELFRFSAATFNAHRIHFDKPYARDVEGYPDLVVQGPLTAARLAELASAKGALKSFAFRAEAPLFVDQPVTLEQTTDATFIARRCDGVIAMTATAEWLN